MPDALPVPVPDPIAVPVPSPRAAERLVACALVREPGWALEVFERCDESDFSDDFCAAVFRAAHTLCGIAGGSAGVWDVFRFLRAEGVYGDALPRLLWGVYHATPTAVMGAYHANLVRLAADRRRLRRRLLAAAKDLGDGRAAADVLGELTAAG